MRYCPVCQLTYSDEVPNCARDGQLTLALADEEDPFLGKFAGSYQVTQKLGEGGMGVVYLAKHPTLGKRAAVKFLQADLNQRGTAAERFFSEAKIVSQLGHENIVDVYDFGVLEDVYPYFVMEYLEGEPLSQLLAREQLVAPDVAIDIVIQLLDALSVAHSQNVVHRDLKPDNTFLLPRRGRYLVKLLDFGIAKLKDNTNRKLTKTGVLIGTPAYMSPEQVEGEVELDGRADLYSVGILFYEMLCGRPPFMGNSMGVVALAHTLDTPPSPRTFRPELSPIIETILEKALQKNRDARYQSAEEMIQALQALQGQQLLFATDHIATPPGGSFSINHSAEVSTGERTSARQNPFEEQRANKFPAEQPLETMAANIVAGPAYSNTNLPTSAVNITPNASQEGTSVAIVSKRLPKIPDAIPPTMMSPIVSSEQTKKPSGANKIHRGRPTPDPSLPTMMTPTVSPSGEIPTSAGEQIPTRVLNDSLPTMMASVVPPKQVDTEMPTMHIGTIPPKAQATTITDDMAEDGVETDPNRESPRNISGPQSVIIRHSGVQEIVAKKSSAPSLDAAPEDVIIAPNASARSMTIAIVALSVIAALLWAFAFRT